MAKITIHPALTFTNEQLARATNRPQQAEEMWVDAVAMRSKSHAWR
jgi:hypothetical protein